MKPIVLRLFAVFILIALIFTTIIIFSSNKKVDELSGQLIVTLNEIQNGDETAQARFDMLKKELKSVSSGKEILILAMVLSLCTCAIFLFYIYFTILRPFHKLEHFAQDIAFGNFNKPLNIPRHNVFGAFSWAFDSMREGLNDSRKAGQEAKEANKILIAAISHDIKTPIASIRACAEAISTGQASNEERKTRYLNTIIRKSDEVTKLTNDLFLHALSDMDKLIIEPVSISLRDFVIDFSNTWEINVSMDIPDVHILADPKRLKEIFGNIISNAEKYVPESPVYLSFKQENSLLHIIFSDKGKSLSPEDVPFIFDKFYRGKNTKDEEGSGLGLYIVSYVAEKLGGRAFAEWTENGLKIIIVLRIS